MAKTVEAHGVTFIHRKPAKPGVYLCVRVDPYDGLIIRSIETAYLNEFWGLRTAGSVLPVERWLSRTGVIKKSAGYYFSEKTIEEMNT